MPVTMPDKFFTPGEDTYGLIGSSANYGPCPSCTLAHATVGPC